MLDFQRYLVQRCLQLYHPSMYLVLLCLNLLLPLPLYVLAYQCLFPLESEQVILQLESVLRMLQPLLELVESLHNMGCDRRT